MTKQEIEILKVEDLSLWTENPRDPIDINSTDFDIICRAIKDENNKWDLQGLINKMGDFYDFSELPTVVKIGKKNVVYDGNRRIAILKYIQNEELYKKLDGIISFIKDAKELKELIELPCNVCNIETALVNVVRKHIGNGSWNELEKDYFLVTHLKKPKSHFIFIEEQTGIISSNPKLAQRFVKEEILTIENLTEIGFEFEENLGFATNYKQEDSNKIFSAIADLVDKGIISTRNNRKQLKEPLITNYPEFDNLIKKFNPQKGKNYLQRNIDSKPLLKTNKTKRRTKKTTQNEIIFGKILTLKTGKINDIYRAICSIYDSNSNDSSILPILGMSMRLITEVAARIYFEENDSEMAKRDQLYSEFLRLAKRDIELLGQDKINFLSLTNEWLSGKENLEGILAKYAHGNITVNKDSLLKHSVIIGVILEHYFKRQ